MSPESAFIPPAPEGPKTPAPELVTPPEIVPPAFVTERAPDAAPQDPAAEAAQRIISSVPGFENSDAASHVPSRDVVEVPMPADPSHVNGWTGDVRRS
jgi:hypothetical protein